ncbi:hypothetical protein Cri9333_4800 (plasmid) [Crinalium epipsammum PCC 9333]|uniref:Uncharacterized protein n=1 Tax=Crinalium epipsammum PCC 9333 TaxID=1173022 RepID=K9W7Z8_9CYAN|nr:hypothetical protein [Crinalium epipsammum]AFZ15570.1 hypothetical protein Cri9333_4800 [Crinalium epipsammum PCC 9333]
MTDVALQLNPYLIARLLEVDEKLPDRKISVYSITRKQLRELTFLVHKLALIVKEQWDELPIEKKNSIKNLLTIRNSANITSKTSFNLFAQIMAFLKLLWLEVRLGNKQISAFEEAIDNLERNLLEQIQSDSATKVITKNDWLVYNQEALASVERGLEQAASNQGRYLGSFAQYADLDVDDEVED